jgi:CRP-like cAMP-binding protein
MAYTHEELDTMIGAERVTVCRILGQFQNEGVVELRRRRIHARGPKRLRRISE